MFLLYLFSVHLKYYETTASVKSTTVSLLENIFLKLGEILKVCKLKKEII